MGAAAATSNILVSELDKKIQLAKEKQLTGILSFKRENIPQWRLYFLAGQLAWASTRTHARRRWYRQLLKYRPDLIRYGLSAYPDWTYNRLSRLVICKKFNREIFSDIVSGYISEVLFDLQQQGSLCLQQTGQKLSYRIKTHKACDFPYINLQNVRIWAEAKRNWQAWENANLAQVNPNDALVIEDLAALEDLASPRLLQVLNALADGNQTLQDIALKTNQPLMPFVSSILPHIQNHALQLKPVGDDISKAIKTGKTDVAVKLAQTIIPKEARMVYVDNSLADSHKMATIVESAGYRYSNIADPLEVLKQIQKLKPKLIFLQVAMPVVTGYELCTQIRRMPEFKETPIVMVGEGNSVTERMRAKMAGASDFLSKPFKPKNVLQTLISLGMI
ncbi:response regulator [Leptothoe kymatousa]|uniref:Response regulator n=1 Tax=Leptothoe kymatousa TAU-MAC 1615 TaxID=2364775 RepID=A0ABS5XY58_9CYAN|nr:response regulator [Leptothoe kymatousa]MBT9310592.1 response regulator [Leptothoe kymatousa TAU-MAC 1615]